MSSAVSAEEDQQAFISICFCLSTTTLLVYEYLITFDREYRLVWKRPFSAATLVFLLARYPLLLVNVINLAMIRPLSTRTCSALNWFTTALELLFILLAAAFSSLRVYALSGRRWQIAWLIFVLSLVSFGVALFVYVREVVVISPPPINCTIVNFISRELTNTLTYVARTTTITADVLVLAVTVHQTYWTRRGVAEADVRTPLHTLILRDGTIYFLAILILNIVDIILTCLGEIFEDTSYLSELIDPVTAIIISRFMLNLREVDVSQCEDQSRPSFVGSIQFAAFVEPLGAPLEHEFSFSAINPGSLDEEGASEEREREDVLDRDEEMMSSQISIRGFTEAEPGPSTIRE